MKLLATILTLFTIMSTTPIFTFSKNANISNWRIVDDIVMGGKSNGTFSLNNDGYGEFSGKISLENNGGFSSVRYNMKTIAIKATSKIIVKLKGDGKTYQLRIKANTNDRHSYIKSFTTTGEWQIISIDLNAMYPTFRGKTLDIPNFDKPSIEELAFLIGNKKEEHFKLLIESINLQ